MRGRMLGKIGLVIVYAACAALLTSCLVGSGSKPKTYKMTTAPSHTLPIYTNGHYISMQYESYLVGSSPQSPGSGITMSWRDSVLPLPFNLGTRSALRFAFEELSGTAVQYIKQDASGSVFLHAFEGVGSSIPGSQTHMFWPNKSTSLTSPTAPSPVQVFWSPIEEGDGVDRAIGGALDFNIVGECDGTTCNSIGTMTASSQSGPGLKVTSSTIQVVTTPLGNFQTYNIRYAGTLAVTNYPSTVTATVGFDYRASCLRPGQNGTASFEGEIWIYPPIGPVKIRNYCVPSVGTPISYSALITGTNLPF